MRTSGQTKRCPARFLACLTVGAVLAWPGLLAVPGLRAQEPAEVDRLRTLSLELVNKARAEQKLPPLQMGKQVTDAAKAHAADMLKRSYFAHDSPDGKNVGDRFRKAGGSRWRIATENIAYCKGRNCEAGVPTVEDFHRGWMNSKGHRENILRKGVTEFGFSIVSEPGKPVYAVQNFAGPGIPNGVKPNEQVKRLSEKELAAKALELLNKERKQAKKPAMTENPVLSKAARSLLPKAKLEEFDLDKIDGLMNKLPEAERGTWQSLTVLAAACGGCGAEPTDADVRSFVSQWLANASNKTLVLNPEATHIGFALAASGLGKKVAIGVVGRKQAK